MPLLSVAPEMCVVLIACGLMVADLAAPERWRGRLGYVATALLIVPSLIAMGALGYPPAAAGSRHLLSADLLAVPLVVLLDIVGLSPAGTTPASVLVADQVAIPFKVVFLVLAGIILLSLARFGKRVRIPQAECSAMVLFPTAVTMFLAGPTEILSIALPM